MRGTTMIRMRNYPIVRVKPGSNDLGPAVDLVLAVLGVACLIHWIF